MRTSGPRRKPRTEVRVQFSEDKLKITDPDGIVYAIDLRQLHMGSTFFLPTIHYKRIAEALLGATDPVKSRIIHCIPLLERGTYGVRFIVEKGGQFR